MSNFSWATAGFMSVVHILSVVALFHFTWGGFLWMLFLYYVTACLGVTLGYHRLLSHRSFSVPKWLERFFATCGALSAEFGPIDWVGLHRQHHKFSDTKRDPHNSHRGFWWSHIGWMLEKVPGKNSVPTFSKDLTDDPYYLFLNKYFLLLQIPVGLVLYHFGGWNYVLWGIFLRLGVVYNVTWLVNSGNHMWGDRPHDSGDNSTNNGILAALTFGEGWHNNHHMFPSSAKQGIYPGQVDITWYHISFLEKLGLAKRVKVATVPTGT